MPDEAKKKPKKKKGLKKGQKKRVLEVYSSFADPGTKMIPSEKIGDAMSALTGVHVLPEEAQLLQKRLDAEATGSISSDAVLEYVEAMLNGPSDEIKEATKEAFGVFDAKHTEVMDAVELKKILDSMPAGLLTEEERSKLIEEIAEDITPDDATFSYTTFIEDKVKAALGKKKKKKKKKKK